MLRSAVEEYLREIGELGPKPLGPKTQTARLLDEAANRKLEEVFSRKLRANDRLVIVATSLVVLSGVSNLLLILGRSFSSTANTSVGGLLFAFQLTLIRMLYQWWKEKSVMDFLIYLSREVPAQEMARIISSFRSNGFKSGRSKANRKPL